MNFRTKITIIIVSTIVNNTAIGQQEIKEIGIGEQAPTLETNDVINYITDKFNMPNKGKFLILDFWATWCNPCIASFGKLDSLKRPYKGELEIMPVTSQDEKIVESFLQQMKKETGISVSSIVNDSILSRYFRHTLLPHYIWINNSGVVKAITGSEEVNALNLRAFMSGDNLNVSMKRDIPISIDMDRPIFKVKMPIVQASKIVEEQISPADLLNYSVFAKFKDGLLSFQDDMRPNRFTATNTTVKTLYQWALGHVNQDSVIGYSAFMTDSRVIYDIPDSLVYHISSNKAVLLDSTLLKRANLNNWNKQNSFCYEVMVPETMKRREKFQVMLKDLNAFFGNIYGIEGIVEKRVINCLVLVKINKEASIESAGGSSEVEENAFYFHLKNKSINFLINRLSNYYLQMSKYPILNETGYSGNIDIDIHCKLSNLSSLNTELIKKGFKFVMAPREIKMIVIRGKGKS